MMAQFLFRFQALLRLRESERRQRQLEFAQAYEADRLLQQQIDAAQAAWNAARETVREAAAPGEVQVDKLIELQRYALSIQVQCQKLAQQQSHIRNELERRRNHLVEANRQVRMLEKLRERQEQVFQVEQQKQEQKIWDEIGGRR
jgi:flagellar FliJ protein